MIKFGNFGFAFGMKSSRITLNAQEKEKRKKEGKEKKKKKIQGGCQE